MSAWLYWLVAGIILVIAEMTTFTFYLLWLGVGAFAAAFSTQFTDNILLQILVGCVTALVLTLFTRPLTRNVRHSAKGFYDPYEHITGKTGTVVESISPDTMGQVRVGSEVWSATSDEFLDIRDSVTVIERSSTILKVKKVVEEEEIIKEGI